MPASFATDERGVASSRQLLDEKNIYLLTMGLRHMEPAERWTVGTPIAMSLTRTKHTGRDEDLDTTQRRPEMKTKEMRTKEMTKAVALLSISGTWVYWAMTHLGSLVA